MTELQTITIKGLDNFQIDAKNRLYWKGEEIVTAAKITLPWWGNVCVIVAALATLGTFILEAMTTANLLPSAPKQVVEVIVRAGEPPEVKAPEAYAC